MLIVFRPIERTRFEPVAVAVSADAPYGPDNMRVISVVDDEGELVCETCSVVTPPLPRVRAAFRQRRVDRGEGLLIQGADSVRTWFVHQPVDVVFLDRDYVVVDIAREVSPRGAASGAGAHAALELPAGDARRRHLHLGQRLGWGVPSNGNGR